MSTATLRLFRGSLRKIGRFLGHAESILKVPKRQFYLYSPEPFHPIPEKDPQWMTAEEAIHVVTSGKFVFVTLPFNLAAARTQNCQLSAP